MIKVFCGERGSGKTKHLIEMANNHVGEVKGEAVFINKDSRTRCHLQKEIRYVAANELGINDCNSLYGLVCGLISENYDVENIYIDGLSGIIKCKAHECSEFFDRLTALANNQNINLFMNVTCKDEDELPETIKEYAEMRAYA